MAGIVEEAAPGLWQVKIQFVHAFLVEGADGLTLVDAGPPGGEKTIVKALGILGKSPADVRSILVTHAHSDHAGGLAAMKRLTGAPAYMHPIDAALTRKGEALRPLTPAPGLLNALICKFLLPPAPTTVDPAAIEHEVRDGDVLPCGLLAVHVPGHCAGQLAFLWPERRALIAADAAANAFGLALSPMYEDLEAGRRSLARLAALDFDVACFGHGRPIRSGASAKFRKAWPPGR